MSYKFVRYYIYGYRTNVVRIRISSHVCPLYVVCILHSIVCAYTRERVTLGLSVSRLCPGLSRHVWRSVTYSDVIYDVIVT